MAIKEKKLKDFLTRLVRASGAGHLEVEIENLFKKDVPVVEKDVAPVVKAVESEESKEDPSNA